MDCFRDLQFGYQREVLHAVSSLVFRSLPGPLGCFMMMSAYRHTCHVKVSLEHCPLKRPSGHVCIGKLESLWEIVCTTEVEAHLHEISMRLSVEVILLEKPSLFARPGTHGIALICPKCISVRIMVMSVNVKRPQLASNWAKIALKKTRLFWRGLAEPQGESELFGSG